MKARSAIRPATAGTRPFDVRGHVVGSRARGAAIRAVLLAPLLAAAFVLAAPLTGTARAADSSIYASIGFSPDGTLFAFEELGVHDGSGAPFLNGYVIDTRTDRFVAGSPIRMGGGEPGDLGQAELQRRVGLFRRAMRDQIGETIGDVPFIPGHVLALSPSSDLERDGERLRVLRRPLGGRIDEALGYAIETVRFEAGTNGCPDFAGPIVGFRLTLTQQGRTQVLASDERVPRSRGCPLRYRLAGVETFTHGSRDVFAVLIQVFSLGFEGEDARWLAVTHTLERG